MGKFNTPKTWFCLSKVSHMQAAGFPRLFKRSGVFSYHQIDEIVSKYNIPSELIINMDQTPLPFFLVSSYTLLLKRDKTVLIRNCSDYRQITGTFAISMTGGFLPIQLIYQGKTDRCHPNFAFPEEFHIILFYTFLFFFSSFLSDISI